jgi:hypothetical protein
MFASDEDSMVFSESAPPASALLHCKGCSHKRQIEYFRATVHLMCRSTYHKRCFFKFQSITVTMIHIALEAFPNTPWIFLYRQPVETIMSHGKRGSFRNANCLRSRRGSTPTDISQNLQSHVHTPMKASDEAWCAAHLNMLCVNALRAEIKYGHIASTGMRRGMLLPYESLPGSITKIVYPLFNIQNVNTKWQQNMAKNSKLYSKSRQNASRGKQFNGDSEEKLQAASTTVSTWVEKLMEPTYIEMRNKSMSALKDLRASNIVADLSVQKKIINKNSIMDWSGIKLLR